MGPISKADYERATSDYTGWCPDCQAFTTEQVEPDADEYACQACDGQSVMGAEQAMLLGEVELE